MRKVSIIDQIDKLIQKKVKQEKRGKERQEKSWEDRGPLDPPVTQSTSGYKLVMK